jgi:hypothetical protein
MHIYNKMSSANSSNIFIDSSIVFDYKKIDVSKIPIPDTSSEYTNFGLLYFKAITTPLTDREQDFMFQVDCSGSMSDTCEDGRTKMQHIIHTLKNMILYFKENPTLKVYVTIHAFDDKIHNILDRILVDETTYDKIITNINTIVPRCFTDIEKALGDSKKYISQLVEQYPSTTKNHIFMTDGQTTCGTTKHEDLCNLVDDSICNIFIGFGIDHDSILLNEISKGKNSNYYFIDKLENAGLVYGEILHGIVYRFLENVEILVTDGLIYDYKTNTWNNSLIVGEIVSESSKFYHLVSNKKCIVKVSGKKIDDDIDISVIISSQEKSSDLTKYIYRQLTQQILFKINDYNKDNKDNYDSIEYIIKKNEVKKNEQKKLKTEMLLLFEELKKYMTDNSLTHDILMKNLCDDIYICHRTFGTKFGYMFCVARESSQGQQRSYTQTQIPDIFPRKNPLRGINGLGFIDNYDDNYDDNYIKHELSESINTPYLSQSKTNVMRSITGENIDD